MAFCQSSPSLHQPSASLLDPARISVDARFGEKEEGQQERKKRGGNGAHGRSLQRDRSPLRNHFPSATMSDCSWKISRCAAVRPAVTGQRLARAPCAWWISGSMAIRLHGHGASNPRFPWIKKRPSALSYADGECQAGLCANSRSLRCLSSLCPCPSCRP